MKSLLTIVMLTISFNSYGQMFGFSGIVPLKGGIGFGLGYYVPDAGATLNSFTIYIGTGKNEIKRDGEFYRDIGQNQFAEDVKEIGKNHSWYGATLGFRITDYLSLDAVLGYKEALYVQNRYDNLTILGNNGSYYTEYRIKDESGFDVGAGLTGYIELRSFFLIPSVTYTIKSGTVIKFGIGFD